MRALMLDGDYGLDNLHLRDVPEPAPGPGEILVRMRSLSLNSRDAMIVSGVYGALYPLPLVPMSDGAGTVEAVGEHVTTLKPGQRVSTLYYADGWQGGDLTPERRARALADTLPGIAQELVVLPEHAVTRIPDYLTFAEAAALPVAGVTAWRALVVDAKLRPGDVVVLQGTGGVSITALQIALAMGCETIITSSSDEKLERAKALGAHHGINYRDVPEWSKACRKLTAGRGVDAVLEVGGGATLSESIKSVRLGGHVAIVGVLAGLQDTFSIRRMIQTVAHIQGVSGGSRDDTLDMLRCAALHKIRPVVDSERSWEEAQGAFRAMIEQRHFGKIVINL